MNPIRLFAISCFALTCAEVNAISLSSQSDFEDLTTQSWAGGSSPVAVTGGQGPSSGALQISATGGNLAAQNSAAIWIGNYNSAGVTGISAWFKNTGASSLGMRLVLFSGPTFSIRWVSSTALTLGANSDWVQHTFLIDSSSLTQVGGSASLSASLADVTRIMFRHDPTGPSANGTGVSGTVRMDNIQAVPEPGTMAALVAGISFLARKRRTS